MFSISSAFKRAFVFYLVLCVPSQVLGAETIVQPGFNTLSTAIDDAADGDTLILTDGSYYIGTNSTTIDKSVIIRAQANNSPIISPQLTVGNRAVMTIGNASADMHLMFAGVRIQSVLMNVVSHGVDLSIVESVLNGQPNRGTGFDFEISADIFSGQEEISNLVLIGNRWTGNGTSDPQLGADHVVIVGNTFVATCNPQPTNCNTGFVAPFAVRASLQSHIIGNEFSNANYLRNDLLVLSGGGLHHVLANRFHNDNDYSDPDIAGAINNDEFDAVSLNTGAAVFRNNLFTFDFPDEVQDIPGATEQDPVTPFRLGQQRAIDVSLGQGTIVIENNVVDYGITTDTVQFHDSVPEAFEVQGDAIVRNNIVTNGKHKVVDLLGEDTINAAVVEYNLCQSIVAGACTADLEKPQPTQISADPLFVDNVGYMLGANSPGIDAGAPSDLLSDVDGTRNDLGVHGGVFPIGQYDVQRETDRTEPYLYPLFEPNASAAGGRLNVRVIGLARSK